MYAAGAGETKVGQRRLGRADCFLVVVISAEVKNELLTVRRFEV